MGVFTKISDQDDEKDVFFHPYNRDNTFLELFLTRKTITLNPLEIFQKMINEILQVEPKFTSSHMERKITDSYRWFESFVLLDSKRKLNYCKSQRSKMTKKFNKF